ncbi:MAG: N-acetylmuramoyl-L-alanine amidase, partial [Anaerolineae bacterium]|nr:N-acetylmuramoyl-L-alanine amidase [Anaerolineae bacterium]
VLRQAKVVFLTAAVLATLFTTWTPLGLFPQGWVDQFAQLFDPQANDPFAGQYLTPTPRPRPRIGIVAGHWGNDSGAVCSDGLTEQQVNLEIATRVKEYLQNEGFDVDLMKEFDEQLHLYRALALVSIHADSCNFIDTNASGYKVAAALATSRPEKAARLVACMHSRYQAATSLPFHSGSITDDMTKYHAFEEIHSETTAVILETGFLNLDRQILTQNPDQIARGITNGVLCFIHNEDASLAPTP